MELINILKPLMELEYQMHRLYMWYSDMFSHHIEARSMFRLMAREELKHKESVQNQFHLIAANLSQYDSVEADCQGMIQLTVFLKQQVDRRSDMTLRESLEGAIQMEKSAAESHYRFLIAKANPVLKELIIELAQADQDHLTRLELFLQSLSNA